MFSAKKLFDWFKVPPWNLVIIFLLLSLGMSLVGYRYYQGQKDDFLKAKGKELSTIVDLKVNLILNWRRERLNDAALIQNMPWIGERVRSFLSGRLTTGLENEIQTWMASLRQDQYEKIFLVDKQGKVRLAVPDKTATNILGPEDSRLVLEALKGEKATLSNLHQGKFTQNTRLSLLVPIPSDNPSVSEPIGLLLFIIDPYRFLFPHIQSWPNSSRSGKTIFNSLQGEEFILFNELSHQETIPLSYRIPIGNQAFSGLWSVYRQEGRLFEGLDYRGKPVLAAGRAIPDSPWWVMVKEDREEFYSPLRERAWMVALLISLMILAAGVSLGFIWRHQRSVYYRNLYLAETKQRALTQHYIYLTKFANDIILLLDQDYRIIEVNDRALAVYGYSREELLSLSARDLRGLHTRSLLDQDLNLPQNRKGIIYETLHRCKDGTEFPVEVSLRLLDVEEGRFFQAIVRDITERKKAESFLAEEKELLRVTLQSIADGVITTDTEGKIILINPVAEELTGWSQNESVGKPLGEVFITIDRISRERCANPVEKVIQTSSMITASHNTILVNKNLKESIISESGAPIRDSKGELQGIVIVFRDITEKVRMEEELCKADKIESLGILAGGIAHDFNNLLMAIIGNLSLAKTLIPLGDEVHENLEEAEKAALRAKGLTQQLLTFSRGGAPVKTISALGAIIKDSALFALRGSKSKCEFIIPADLWPAELDAGQISQAIQNLVVNADQAMPEGGLIQIEAKNITRATFNSEIETNGVEISIHDNGPGIYDSVLPKIFDPFFTTKPQGSGLGLTTVYSIIHHHNGKIRVKSEINRGTTFSFLLPAVNTVKQEGLEAIDILQSGQGRILVMDDDLQVNKVVSRILERLGYRIEVSYDGREALTQYQSALTSGNPFNAVIMDLTIPGGMGGKETIQELLKMDPQARAIVASGYSNDPVLSEYKKYGFKGMITKPFTIDSLRNILHQVLQS